jgi:hypothetical protein
MKTPIVAVILFAFLAAGGVATCEAAISVKDTKGRSMDVEVLAYTPKTGVTRIKRTDGQVFTVNVNVFDEDSQKRIIEAAPKPQAELRIEVSVGRRRERLGDSSYMKKQTISASVGIDNESLDIDFSGGKGTLFLIARQTRRYSEKDSDYGKVLSKQEFKMSIPASEEVEYEAKPVVTEYDSDRDSSNIGGWEYYGYLFILEDDEGAIHSVVTSIGNLKKQVENDDEHARKLLGLSKESIVEKNLEKR